MFSIFQFSVMNSGLTAMVFKSPIDGVTRARAFYLCRLKGFSIRKVAEICNISRGSVCRIAKEQLLRRSIPKAIFKTGPKFKLSERQQRLLIRAIEVLRNREGNFTCKRLMQEAYARGLCKRQDR